MPQVNLYDDKETIETGDSLVGWDAAEGKVVNFPPTALARNTEITLAEYDELDEEEPGITYLIVPD
jgi:hypothetical protein